MKITPEQLYQFLQAKNLGAETYEEAINEGIKNVNQETFDYLSTQDIDHICVSWAMSEGHLGGGDMVELAIDVISSIEDGYKVVTWYGPDTEVLIAGIKDIDVVD